MMLSKLIVLTFYCLYSCLSVSKGFKLRYLTHVEFTTILLFAFRFTCNKDVFLLCGMMVFIGIFLLYLPSYGYFGLMLFHF